MNDLYIHQLETENKQLRTELHIERARIQQALEEFKYFFPILTTPIGEVVHLQDKMKHVEKAIKILGGKENESIIKKSK